MAVNPLYVGHFVESVLWGIYTTLFAITFYVLITRSKLTTNKVLLVVTTLMYTMGSAHVILDAQLGDNAGQSTNASDATFPLLLKLKGNAVLLTRYLPPVNFVLGDGIVAWRAWVIYNKSLRIVLVPIFLLFATTCVVITDLILGTQQKPGDINFALYTTAIALTLANNLLATGLIGYRTWVQSRHSAVANIRVGRDRTRAVLLLLLESGAGYCVIWIAYLILVAKVRPGTNHPFGKSFLVFDSAVPQLIGIYPTLVIVLCALQRSYFNETATSNSQQSFPIPPKSTFYNMAASTTASIPSPNSLSSFQASQPPSATPAVREVEIHEQWA